VAYRPMLTEDQISQLFDPPTDQRALIRHYTLSPADLALIRRGRGDHHRLGYALMLCYLRHPGRPLRAGDVVTVTRLDRLARSTRDLLEIAERIKEAGAGLRSMAEPWADTTTPAGRMILTVFAGIADFERSLIVERTSTGRIAAKARGVRFGPKPSLSAEQIAHARQLVEQDGRPVAEVAKLLGVHRATLYRVLGDKQAHVHSSIRGGIQAF